MAGPPRPATSSRSPELWVTGGMCSSPYQRGSSSRPLTVATHVQDLDDLIRERCAGRPTVLVGHSWGAMLALAYAADHPTSAAALVLIGCGTFSPAACA